MSKLLKKLNIGTLTKKYYLSLKNSIDLVAFDNRNISNKTYIYRLCKLDLINLQQVPTDKIDDSFKNVNSAAENLLTTTVICIKNLVASSEFDLLCTKSPGIVIVPELNQTILEYEQLISTINTVNLTEYDIIKVPLDIVINRIAEIPRNLQKLSNSLYTLLYMLKYTFDDFNKYIDETDNNLNSSQITLELISEFNLAVDIIPSSFNNTYGAFKSISLSIQSTKILLENLKLKLKFTVIS